MQSYKIAGKRAHTLRSSESSFHSIAGDFRGRSQSFDSVSWTKTFWISGRIYALLSSNALAEVASMTPDSGGYAVLRTRLCMMRNAWCVIREIPLRTAGWSNSPGESIRDLFSASEHSQGGAQRSEQYLYGAQRAT